jgi:hypothetical protein
MSLREQRMVLHIMIIGTLWLGYQMADDPGRTILKPTMITVQLSSKDSLWGQ